MRKWTYAAYLFLFERLTDNLGPVASWEARHRPGRGLDNQYQDFLASFAKAVGAKSVGAVELQIMAAIYPERPIESMERSFDAPRRTPPASFPRRRNNPPIGAHTAAALASLSSIFVLLEEMRGAYALEI
jgi:hypothetical protein